MKKLTKTYPIYGQECDCEEIFEQLGTIVYNTIGEYYSGYDIEDMKTEILSRLSQLFFKYYSNATRYCITGEFDDEERIPYISNLCKGIAKVWLNILQSKTHRFWKDFELEEQGYETIDY